MRTKATEMRDVTEFIERNNGKILLALDKKEFYLLSESLLTMAKAIPSKADQFDLIYKGITEKKTELPIMDDCQVCE